MDYSTARALPHLLSINGTAYKIPRFLNAQFIEYAAEHRKKIEDSAVAQLRDPDSRARFLMYHQPPPLDTSWVAQHVTTPEGVEVVIRSRFAKAGVPKPEIEDFIENTDPMILRALADELRSGNGMIATQLAASGDAGPVETNPPIGQPPTSDGSPTTTPLT